MQPRRSGAVVQQRGLGAEAHVEAALQSTRPLGLPPVVPHGAQEGLVCLNSLASRPTRALGRILRLIGSPDTRVAMETAVGFQDWGSPKPSGVFHSSVEPSTCNINVSLLLEGAPVRNEVLVSKL